MYGAAAIVVVTAGLVTASPASASSPGFGSVNGVFCGARGTFKTFDGSPQVRYMADRNGDANSAHNSGCFGVTPAGRVWWTPRTNPDWRPVSGNGIATWAYGSYVGTACSSGSSCLSYASTVIEVETSAGRVWDKQWDPFSRDPWDNPWVRA